MIFDKKPALLLTPPPERTNHRASLLQNSFVGYRLNSVSRWIREFEREERPEARPRGHRASIFSDEERQELIELVGKRVDMTLEEMRSHFAKDCSLNAIHKLVKSPGFVFKKR
ncbi:MAG: hypothetical protein LBQ62_00290 [Candidatus Accumulibacter sp.]|jgi:transposase|nr:hypothetical protein [Accumulibacter sp.]